MVLQDNGQMENFIDIQSSKAGICMTKQESNAVIEALHECDITNESIDHLDVLRKLQPFLTTTVYKRLSDAVLLSGSSHDFLYILRTALQYLSFCEVVYLFQELGRGDVANRMINLNFKATDSLPNAVLISNNGKTHNLYVKWKGYLDDNIFRDCLGAICEKIKHTNKEITKTGSQIFHVQQNLDKKVIFCVLKFQRSDTKAKKEELLQELQRYKPGGTELRSLHLVLLGKLAITAAKDNNVEQTDQYIAQALTIAVTVQPCLATISLFHDILYSYRSLFNFNPTRAMLNRVIKWGSKAMNSIIDESEDVQLTWKRLFLQYMFLSLLRINAVFEMLDTEDVDQLDLNMAQDALSQYSRLLPGIPARRKMIYYLSKARYSELTEDFEYARKYAEEALELAADGMYFSNEYRNIQKYSEMLIHREGGAYKSKKNVL